MTVTSGDAPPALAAPSGEASSEAVAEIACGLENASMVASESRTILVAGPDPEMRTYCETVLEPLGYSVTPAEDEAEGFTSLADHERSYLRRVLVHTKGRISGPRCLGDSFPRMCPS